MNLIFQTDGYKVDHRRQYPDKTEIVYSNMTPRASRIPGQHHQVFFGLQYFLQRFLSEDAIDFFGDHKDYWLKRYQQRINGYLGPNAVGTDHIGALHDLDYIPLKFWALPEGTHTPLRCPMFTFANTHPDFGWVTNYFETLLSSVLWPMCTSATMAYRYRALLDKAALETGGDPLFVPWQGHDFSFRGMMGPEAAAMSGAAHLTSFTGTDTLPALDLLEDYYDATGLVGGSVPATEHSVMCAGGADDEQGTFERLLNLYPTGIISVVSDTWDLWKVTDKYLPALKERIMARDGKLVIRPDSGDPVDILCGRTPLSGTVYRHSEALGVIERLWEIFGGTVNAAGYKVLDSHIGAIYGDSITYERAQQICERLKAKGFASTNVVLGIGSYTYQYTTRDTYGNAVKATMAQVDGVERQIFKKPKTDDGTKNSAKGCISVVKGDFAGTLLPIDGLTLQQVHYDFERTNLLQPVWADGEFLQRTNLEEVRANVAKGPRS